MPHSFPSPLPQIPMFQQLTGINAIMFYAPQLFESVGHDASGALLSTVITGAVNVASTVVAIIMVDRWVGGCGCVAVWARGCVDVCVS